MFVKGFAQVRLATTDGMQNKAEQADCDFNQYSKTYGCTWQSQTLSFTIDFTAGFTCVDSNTKNVIWRFKFSQLKGSSDDGKTCVKLLFQNTETKQIEMKELEFPDLTAVLHCIHSFIAAKVAAVDPVFVDSQSVARKYMYSS
ncbi:hypothetical protein scyTo_0010629 [Scyliorhinus torazame]|uniref:Syntrophin C-terminal PH domain-containing protein n=1 Tax=Scyliorhinus torazame TaxID=75743 RepID=A0A401P9I5_SCYTO|nr:hypothetical protein [Scyliorhinus torazame]